MGKVKPEAEIEIQLVERFGFRREEEPVRIGVPFPQGLVQDGSELALVDEDGLTCLLQTSPLAWWSNGSAQWMLLDFLASVPEGATGHYTLRVKKGISEEPCPVSPITCEANGQGLVLDTGAARFELSRGTSGPFRSVSVRGHMVLSFPGSSVRFIDARGRTLSPEVDLLVVEEIGPVRCTVLASGSFRRRHLNLAQSPKLKAEKGTSRGIRFTVRMEFFAGLALCRIEFEIHNPQPAWHPGGLWDLGDPGSIAFRDLSMVLSGVKPNRGVEWRAELGEAAQIYRGPHWLLYQDSSGGKCWDSPNHVDWRGNLTVSFPGHRIWTGPAPEAPLVKEGKRATPYLRVGTAGGWMAAGVVDFWQNFPKALEVSGDELKIGLFPAECRAGFELQGGEKKRHTVIFEFGVEDGPCRVQNLQFPLVARLDPDWVEATRAVPYFIPEQKDPNSRYVAYVRAAVEGPQSFFEKREAVDEYGWRNFGDLYADHEAIDHQGPEPLVSHYNNQYDFIYGAFVHFLRTGDPRWHQLMADAARHVSDIDIYHTDGDKPAYNHGLFWHTDHYRDAGTSTHRTFTSKGLKPKEASRYGGGPCNEHNYTTGLLHYYYLTGDPWAREAVIELAGWVLAMDDGSRTLWGLVDDGPTGLASQTVSPAYHKPGRGAGNSVNALLDAYRLTGDRRYLKKAEKLIRRCIHPQDDIASLDLTEPEHRWSYLVFLQVLGKYLDVKRDMGELDYNFFYARDSLLHYADWMAENEVPYKEVLHKVEIPTETWPAQDVRKSCVLNLARKYAPPGQAERYAERARHFFDRCLDDLLSFDTSYLTRPMVLMAVYGSMQGYFDQNEDESIPYHPHAHRFGEPERFEPQRTRVRRTLGRKLRAVREQICYQGLSRLREILVRARWTFGQGGRTKKGPGLQMRPRVAYLVHSLNLGGTERLAAKMSRALQGEFDISIVCLDEPGLWAAEARGAGMPVYCLYRQPGLDLRLAWRLARLARRLEIDLFHAHQCTPWFYGGLARLIYPRAKLLLEEHGRHYPEVKSRKRALFNRLVLQPLTSRIVAVSEDVKERLVRYEGLSRERIEVIYNGARLPPALSSEERDAIRREFGFDPKDVVVGTVGRFDPIKNLPLFLQALIEARRSEPRLRGLLVGDGPCFEEVRSLAASLGLNGAVRLPGYRPDAGRIVAAMDIFVLPSLSEGTSVALLEAMAAGIPAAVTAVGGNPEVVVHGQTGWVVPSGSVEGLCAAMREAASDPFRICEMGQAARRRFEEKFAFERMIEAYRRIYLAHGS